MAEKLASQTDRPAASAPETPLQLSPSQQSVVQEDISPVVLRRLQTVKKKKKKKKKRKKNDLKVSWNVKEKLSDPT